MEYGWDLKMHDAIRAVVITLIAWVIGMIILMVTLFDTSFTKYEDGSVAIHGCCPVSICSDSICGED